MTMKTLGERIRELREQLDISVRELAKKVGKSAAFLSDIELGRRHPSDAVLADIARRLGTQITDLRKYDTRPPVTEMKRLAASNPTYGLLFRKVVEDTKINPQDMIDFLDRKRSKKS